MSCSAPRIAQPLGNREFNKLQDYKENLVSEVSCAKLVTFSEELYNLFVISREVKDAFALLDHDRLDSKLRARYLLLHVCEGVKRDVKVFYDFLKALAKLGGSADKVSRRLSEELHVSERGAGSESHEKLTTVVNDISLSEVDVPILMDSLVEVSNKWEEIGIALGLPRHSISECKGSSNAVSLTNILVEWMLCKHKGITLNKLKLTLDSQLVGGSSLAPIMEKRFRDAKRTNIVPVANKNGSGSENLAIEEADNSEAKVATKLSLEFEEICLSESDVSILSELLVVCAHKWNHIGTALGLPVSILKKLEAKCLTSEADILCLRDILFAWITGAHGVARRVTLNNLKLTLESQLVGLHSSAYGLEERLIKARRQQILSVPITPAAKRPHLDSTLAIVYQQRDVEVADGKSTLLEVQVISNASVRYQWMKDGKSLSDNLAYSGTLTDILAINLVSQGTEGEYSCRVSKGTEEVISKVIVVTVIFPPEKKTLLNSYLKRREIPKGLWPTIGTSTFISLTLIEKNKLGNDNYSVRGDADAILESKRKVVYKDVFSKYERGSLVLVEGRPGSGKTMLVHKIIRDWATRGDVLKNAKMVFDVPLRSFANRKLEHLSDILEIFYRSKEECEKVLHHVQSSHGEGICFLFDGLDEYQPQDESNSVIYKLFHKEYLPEAMVIVAARPVATATLAYETTVTKRIELHGFTKEQVFEYIDKFPFSFDVSHNGSSSSNLKAYLDSHLTVLHLCYLPVHVAMICFLYEHEKRDIPYTETEIYEHFTRFIVMRKLRRSNKKVILHSLEDIPGDHKDHFRKICHLAFDMTINSKQVVHQNDAEVSLSLDTGPDDAPSLGLVTIGSKLGIYGLDDTYAFLHLTFQEYLAAFYIAKLGEGKQMEIIRSYEGDKHMLMLWKFYCGIVNFEDKEAQIQLIMRSGGNLLRVQYAFESQQRVVCDSVLEFGRTSVLDFRASTLTPIDLTALAYVMSNTSHPVTKLVMKWCNLHEEHVRAFLREVSNNNLMFIQTLDLSYNNIGADGGAEALANGLKYFTSLQTLHLSDNHIGANGVAALADGLLVCKHLQTLNLSGNKISADGAAVLADRLKSCNRLQTLCLLDSNIGADGAAALANLKCHVHHD